MEDSPKNPRKPGSRRGISSLVGKVAKLRTNGSNPGSKSKLDAIRGDAKRSTVERALNGGSRSPTSDTDQILGTRKIAKTAASNTTKVSKPAPSTPSQAPSQTPSQAGGVASTSVAAKSVPPKPKSTKVVQVGVPVDGTAQKSAAKPIFAKVDGSASPASTRLLPFQFARRFGAVILDQGNHQDHVVVACKTRPKMSTLSEVKRFARKPVKVRMVTEDEFEKLVTSTYARDSSEARQMVEDLGDELDLASLAESVPETEDLLEQEDDAPIIRLINALLAEAIRENASDIHIETFEKELVVRFRVDGVMRQVVRPKRQLAPLLVSRIKVMARLDIAEKRVPQDGRISLRIGGREVDVRVSTMPASNGERVVLRLLDKQAGRLKLTNLGMDDASLDLIRSVVSKPHGIFLVTGPTGSGKTTTLYSSLAELNTNTINILTVEDPIEYNLPGIGQTQVNTKAEMTFARGLRAILRQDPDVVMVGEIRDLETAEVAVQASLTGHLVMSTLHTNTAVGAVTRLIDMGVEPFLLSSSLVGVLAQRLVRVLCPDCRQQRTATPSERAFLKESQNIKLFESNGCEMCGQTGYRGRTGIYEMVLIDDGMRQLIHDQVSEQELTAYARRRTLGIRDDGKAKVLSGVTTVQEVLRVTLEE